MKATHTYTASVLLPLMQIVRPAPFVACSAREAMHKVERLMARDHWGPVICVHVVNLENAADCEGTPFESRVS